ncbi:Bifunctional 3'-phosphoadenosine 5'-phosphosulfate synthase 2 [Cichlidogyrus casuarinus]|uniref:Bifunctional 3'-phosphoadenosine 5'-phosphosulfate synthase 2 n=1 Tax=Cichlidogyrus casuarinus TaxID=1844966 RepID=A0ABD2QIL6_9PLAT
MFISLKAKTGICSTYFSFRLSGAGKTTIAFAVEQRLTQMGLQCYSLDGDNIRQALNQDLSFSEEDREENNRRIGEVAKLFADSGTLLLCYVIAHFQNRDIARQLHHRAKLPFFEIYVNAPIDICQARDPKGLYAKAKDGLIANFTGVSADYEPPIVADFELKTDIYSVDECVDQLILFLQKQGVLLLANSENSVFQPKELFVNPDKLEALRQEMLYLPNLAISDVDLQWIQVLSEGWAVPLTGFMREKEYLEVLHFGGIKIGRHFHNLTIPIVLAVTDDQYSVLSNACAFVLAHCDKSVAVLRNPEFYRHRKEERVCRTFGTSHPEHPGIKLILNEGDWLVGGDLEVLDRIRWNDDLDDYRLTPRELRDLFSTMKASHDSLIGQLGCADSVFAFQLRNPIHNGHALLMQETRKKLLEEQGFKNPVLLLHPLGGWTKDDDVPLKTRILQHLACIEDGVLDKDSTVLAILPSPMLYAGPKEVQWHARCRLVAGANFYIVGRDPAGLPHPGKPGEDLYESTHGGKVLSAAPGLEGLSILPFTVAAYDTKAKKMALFDSARKEDFLFISGTKMRSLAKSGESPPDGFMAPKAWTILRDYYQSLQI